MFRRRGVGDLLPAFKRKKNVLYSFTLEFIYKDGRPSYVGRACHMRTRKRKKRSQMKIILVGHHAETGQHPTTHLPPKTIAL